jgi:hypothetical protein
VHLWHLLHLLHLLHLSHPTHPAVRFVPPPLADRRCMK